MDGTAPATDHYFQGGDLGGSDDSYDFESYRAGENMEDLEISGYNFTGLNDSMIECVTCGKTFIVGSYPRTSVGQVEIEAQNHSATHQDLDELFNISGLSGTSDGSCKRCGAIPENGDYKGHLRTHGIGEADPDYAGDRETIDGLLKKNGKVTFEDFLGQSGDYPQDLGESKASEGGFNFSTSN